MGTYRTPQHPLRCFYTTPDDSGATLTACVLFLSVGGTVAGVGFPSDVTDRQWSVLEPLLTAGKRGPRHTDLRNVINGVLYVAHTGCQWRFLPGEYGKWTRLWSQFRRWSRNGTWTRVLAALHRLARTAAGRAEASPSLLVIDSSLARGASNGGATFHVKGGPYGRTSGAKRVVAVDVTGLPVAAVVVPASAHENVATAVLMKQLATSGCAQRLEVLLVDRGTTARAAAAIGKDHGIEVRRIGWDDKQPVFRPIAHAWRVEVAHGRLGRSRRLAKSFENTLASATGWLQLACIAGVLAKV